MCEIHAPRSSNCNERSAIDCSPAILQNEKTETPFPGDFCITTQTYSSEPNGRGEGNRIFLEKYTKHTNIFTSLPYYFFLFFIIFLSFFHNKCYPFFDRRFFLTAIWLSNGQLWAIIMEAASLNQC